MDKEEVVTFLEKKLNLQMGTIDDEGDPNINQYGLTTIRIGKNF